MLRIAQFVNLDAPRFKGMSDARRRLDAVGDGDHHWRRGRPSLLPLLERLAPVIPEQVVRIEHQVGQRFVRLGAAIQVVFYFRVVVDVVEPRAVGFGVRQDVVADDDARRLDQARFNGIIQPEVADDPAEQSLLAAPAAAGCKGVAEKS